MGPRETLVRGLVAAAGLTRRLMPPGSFLYRRVFLPAYFAYKRRLEDPFAALVRARPELFRGGHVVDVGANVGYTATVFAPALEPGFRVFAFEPDVAMHAVLLGVICDRRLGERVHVERAAVGAEPGTIRFWHNPAHQGDHRVYTPELARTGRDPGTVTEVPMIALDGFLAGRGPIAFIKIDVQGWEPGVCAGMAATLAANPRVAVAVEFSPADLRDQGHDPAALLAFFLGRGYVMTPVRRGLAAGSLTPADALALADAHGYLDLLFTRAIAPVE
jgi:FkbM family methyltransferase